MRGNARIRYEGGMLMLPAVTPYDRQELFGNLEWCVGHYGRVRFEIDGSDWTVSRATALEPAKACRACDAPCTALVFAAAGRRVLCGRCMRLASDEPGKRRPPRSAGADAATAPIRTKVGT